MSARAFIRQRPLVCFAAALAAGIALGILWHHPNWPLIGGGLVCAAVLSGLLLRAHAVPAAGICLLFLFGGLALGAWRSHPALPPPGKYQVSATVAGESQVRAEEGQIKAALRDVQALDANGVLYTIPQAYWTYVPDGLPPPLWDGQQVRFAATLYHPAPQQNPYGFDFRLFLLQKGIAVGFSGARQLALVGPQRLDHADFWLRLKKQTGALFDRLLGPQSGLAKALIVGDREGLEEDTTLFFQDAGVAHVLAVSGLHISILMGIVLFFLRRLHASPRLQLVLVSALLIAYCFLLGFAASVVRASILTIVLLFGRTLRRRADPLTSLALAMIVILLLRPLDLVSVGFQLSFLAVLGIFVLGDRLENWWLHPLHGKIRSKAWQQIVRAYIATLSATAFTALPVAYIFHKFSLIGLLLGPLICLLLGGLMAGLLLLLAAGIAYWPLAAAIAPFVARLSQGFVGLIQSAAQLPLAVVRLPAPGWALMAAGFGGLWLCSRYCLLRRDTKAVTLAALLTLALAFGRPAKVGASYLQLSCGNADAAVIESKAKTYVVDAGSHGGDLASYLLSRGLAVDTLFLTHLHADHAGGLAQLLDARVPIGRIVLPDGAQQAQGTDQCTGLLDRAGQVGIPLQYVHAGAKLADADLSMRVLWPMPGGVYPGVDANDSSLAMLWQLNGLRLITCGDLTADFDHYLQTGAHVFKVSHHGSKGATSAQAIAHLQPQAALLTVLEPWPQRAQAVLERLAQADTQVFSTGAGGALRVVPQQGRMAINEWTGGWR